MAVATAATGREVKAVVSSAAREVTSSAIAVVAVVAVEAVLAAAMAVAAAALTPTIHVVVAIAVMTVGVADTIDGAQVQATVPMTAAAVVGSIAEAHGAAIVDHHLAEATEVPAHGTARIAADETGHHRTVEAQLAAIAARRTPETAQGARHDAHEDQDLEMGHHVVVAVAQHPTLSAGHQTLPSLAMVLRTATPMVTLR